MNEPLMTADEDAIKRDAQEAKELLLKIREDTFALLEEREKPNARLSEQIERRLGSLYESLEKLKRKAPELDRKCPSLIICRIFQAAKYKVRDVAELQ